MLALLGLLTFLIISHSAQPHLAAQLNAEGLKLLDHGKFKEAAEKFRSASRVDPKNITALNNLGHSGRIVFLQSRERLPRE